LSEILVVHERSRAWSDEDAAELARTSRVPLKFHRNPREYAYGDARKAAFEYVIARNFAHVICVRAEDRHPITALPELLKSVDAHPADLIIAARTDGKSDRRIGTGIHERLLKLGISDYQSSYRIYPTAALRALPFQLNADDRSFDTELLIQCRGLGVGIREVQIPDTWNEWDHLGARLRAVTRSGLAAVGYRLHQLHVTRRGQYLIDHDIQYTLKYSSTGSHMQIVNSIRPNTRVLDLGCSQGLLARPLFEKQVRVTGVDVQPESNVTGEMSEYFQRDLEEPCELPIGRIFDYVVVADVIEHVKNRSQLIRSARRYLKEGGRLIISTGNVAIWFYRLSLLAGRFEYGPRGILDRTHVHLYTRDTFRREVERAGFHVLEERCTSLPFEVVFQSTGRSVWVRRIAKLYHLMARVWPEMFAYQFILEAEIETLDDEATLSREDRPAV
jgi:SAM-dependent methyltransferase